MAITSLIVANLTTSAPYAASFVVEVYSDSGLTTIVGHDSCPAVSGGSGFVQSRALVVSGLTLGATYYARAGVVAPVTGTTTWSGTDTVVMGSNSAPTGVTYTHTLTPGINGIAVSATPASIPTDTAYYDAVWVVDGSTPVATAAPAWTGNVDGSGNLVFFAGASPSQTVTVYVRAVNTGGQKQTWTSLGSATVLATLSLLTTKGDLAGFSTTNTRVPVGANGTFVTADSTQATGLNYRVIAGSDLPNPSSSTKGGVQSIAPVTHQFLTGISTSGVPSQAQPAASDVSGLAPSATTDTTNATNITSGTLPTARLPTNVTVSLAGITIDGGGSAPTTGSKGLLQVPFNGTITGWTMLADVTGSASITVKKSTFAGFPTNTSIVASAPPALSTQQNATSTTLTGWTTTVTAGDVLEFVLASVSTLTRLTLEIQITRS